MNYFLIVQEKFNFFYKKLHFSIIFQSFGLKIGTFSNSLLTVFGLVCPLLSNGAPDRTRTCTSGTPDPKSGASTNSATGAFTRTRRTR